VRRSVKSSATCGKKEKQQELALTRGSRQKRPEDERGPGGGRDGSTGWLACSQRLGLRPGDSYTGRPQLCNHGGGLLLVRANAYTQARALRGLGGSGVKRPAPDDFEPRTFLNLYKIAHSELMVDKWNNFAFRLCLASAIVKVSGVQERQCSRLAQHAVGIASRYRLD
jgi:hypothetical protein